MRNDESFLLEKRQHIWQPGGFVLQFAVLWSHSAGMKMCALLPRVSHGNWDLTLCVKVFPTEIDDFFFFSFLQLIAQKLPKHVFR